MGGDYYTRIYGGGELVLTGDETYKGKVTDKTSGISLYGDGAKFIMKNVDYKAAKQEEEVYSLIKDTVLRSLILKIPQWWANTSV